jgi:hypothetical protein
MRLPQSLPAHQIAQSNLSIPGSAPAMTTVSASLLSTAQKEPAATTAELLPDSISSSSGRLAISAGVRGTIAIE